MGHAIKIFIILMIAFFIMDYLWLSVIAKHWYVSGLRPMLRMQGESLQPIIWAAVAVYILLTLAIQLFVLPHQQSYFSAAIQGALLGLIIYGVYEYTNYCLIQGWPLYIVFIDWVWGGFLCAVVSIIARYFDLLLK